MAQAWRSSLYPENWTLGYTDTQGNFLQDFSYAGYWRGEKQLPSKPPGSVYNVVTQYGADASGKADSTAAIQNAINAAGAAGGGVVYLPAGTYRVHPQGTSSSALWINKNNVVLRGAGKTATFLYNDTPNMREKSVIRVAPDHSADWHTPTNAPTAIRGDINPLATVIPVSSVNGYSVNDFIVLHSDATDAFIAEHGMAGKWNTGAVKGPSFYRKITAIDTAANTLTVDIPIRYSLKARDKARVYKVGEALQEIGIEQLSIGMKQHTGSSWGDLDYKKAGTAAYEVHGSKAIGFSNVKNSWVDQVDSFKPSSNTSDLHLLSHGIVLYQSRTITVQNTHMQKPQYRGEGGNGYLYLMQGEDNLVQHATASFGRHSFTFQYMWTSGNVIHNSTSNQPRLATDFHMYLSMANLLDNMTMNGDFIEAVYRPYGTVEHGWTTSQSVIWNTNGVAYAAGQSAIVKSKQFGRGYVIGTRGEASRVEYNVPSTERSAPQDFVEGVGRGGDLAPQSLYLDQKQKRSGDVTVVIYTPIPGRIEAEQYSAMSGVQLENTKAVGGGLNVGWIDAGDWMDYAVNVAVAGSYKVELNVASQVDTGSLQLKLGDTVLSTISVPNTGGWQEWKTVSADLSLSAGQMTLRLLAAGPGFNLNWMQFTNQQPVNEQPTPQKPVNLIKNPGFETGNLEGWTEWHNGAESACKVDTDKPHTGSNKLTHWLSGAYQQLTSQLLTVPNGIYSVSVWARSGGGHKALHLFAKNYGAAEVQSVIGNNPVVNYTKYTIDSVNVTNGRIEIGVWSDANAGNWAAFDDFELVKK